MGRAKSETNDKRLSVSSLARSPDQNKADWFSQLDCSLLLLLAPID